MKKKSRTQLKKQADKLFSLIVRSRGSCERCATTRNLQCAHIQSRTNLHLRWDEKNALCLCVRCHLYWAHKNPLEFATWYVALYPKENAYLMKEKNVIEPNMDYEVVIERLNKRLDKV